TFEHQLGRRSLERQSRTSIWPPIIGEFESVAIVDHPLEHQLGRRSLGSDFRTLNWSPIIGK
ncbi:hypothetical protein BLOT_014676, partial [Blomia tropicalis]